MNFLYTIIAVLILGSAYYFFADTGKTSKKDEVVPQQAEFSDEKDEDGEGGNDDAVTESDDADTLPEAQVLEDEADTHPTFELKGSNYKYDVTEIRVKKGDTVTINFESAQGFHDWAVDEFDASTDAVKPGVPTSVTFTADKTGVFEYYCSVGSHRAQGMVGVLVVE